MKFLETATEELKTYDNKTDKLAQFRQRVNDFDQPGLTGYLGSVQSELSSILFDLPFSDKKRLVESVISPEIGGKVFGRYLRSNDFLDTG